MSIGFLSGWGCEIIFNMKSTMIMKLVFLAIGLFLIGALSFSEQGIARKMPRIQKPLIVVNDSLSLEKLAALLRMQGRKDTILIDSKREQTEWYDHPWVTAVGAIMAVLFSVGLNYFSSKRLNRQQAEFQATNASTQAMLQDRITQSQNESQERIARMQTEHQTNITQMNARFEMETLRVRGVIENLKLIFDHKTEIVLGLSGKLQPWVTAEPMDSGQNQYTLRAYKSAASLQEYVNVVASLGDYKGILGRNTLQKIIAFNAHLLKDLENAKSLPPINLQFSGRAQTDKIRAMVDEIIQLANSELQDEIVRAIRTAGATDPA